MKIIGDISGYNTLPHEQAAKVWCELHRTSRGSKSQDVKDESGKVIGYCAEFVLTLEEQELYDALTALLLRRATPHFPPAKEDK